MPSLRISNLGRTIHHGDGELRIVEDISIVVPPGVAVGVTGPLDAGWRSLLRLIVGLDPATAGTIELSGNLSREDFRQEVVLASALDPLLDHDLDRVARDFSRLAVARRRRTGRASAHALRTAAGVAPGGKLSGSERLRLCVALASSLRPSHVLLEVDPPLSSTEERRLLVEMIRRVLATGIGMLIGTRDEILLAAVAGMVLILEDGRMLAEGTPETVLSAAWNEARTRGLR